MSQLFERLKHMQPVCFSLNFILLNVELNVYAIIIELQISINYIIKIRNILNYFLQKKNNSKLYLYEFHSIIFFVLQGNCLRASLKLKFA